MRKKGKKQPTDHEFSLSSGQMVGLIAGGIAMVLLAFIAGLLIGRYEKTQQFLAIERQSAARSRTTAVPLTAAALPQTQETTAAKPKTPAAKPTPPAKPASPKSEQPAEEPAKPTPPTKPREPVPPPAKPAEKKPAKPKPPDTGKKPRPTVTARAKYAVQVFASRSGKVTGDYVKKLEDAGFPAWTREPNRGAGDVWYRAMIGRFDTLTDAKAELKKLNQRKEFADAYVTGIG